MAKKLTFNDVEGTKHFGIYVTSYGNVAYTKTLDEAKTEAAKLAKTYPNRGITIYQAITQAEETVTPLTWSDLA